MKIIRKAHAGSFESSDILILVEPTKEGTGRNIQLKSIVEKQYGETIKKVITEKLDEFDVSDIHLVIEDKGALNATIKARMETVLLRASDQQKGTMY